MSTSAAPEAAPARTRRNARKAKPSCDRCYFGARGLCALELGEPCSTFRPDCKDGLHPPTQPALLIRGEEERPPLASLAAA